MRIVLASLALLCVLASAASACPYYERTNAANADAQQTAQTQPDTEHN